MRALGSMIAAALCTLLAGCGGGQTTRPESAAAAARHAPAGDHGHGHGHYHHRFRDAEHWSRVFDDPARDAWQKPDEVIAALALAPSARVADLGAGTGYFTVRLARQVPAGTVYAVDIEQDMVRHVRERAAREGLSNVVAVQASPSDAPIPEPVDLVLVVDTYHHIADRVDYFRRLSASLAPGGRLSIIDFTRESPIGPPKQHRIPAEAVIDELARAGYTLEQSHALLPHQYFLIFTRAAQDGSPHPP